jgi:hypothetical protein
MRYLIAMLLTVLVAGCGFDFVRIYKVKRLNDVIKCEQIIEKKCGIDLINCDDGGDHLCQHQVEILGF